MFNRATYLTGVTPAFVASTAGTTSRASMNDKNTSRFRPYCQISTDSASSQCVLSSARRGHSTELRFQSHTRQHLAAPVTRLGNDGITDIDRSSCVPTVRVSHSSLTRAVHRADRSQLFPAVLAWRHYQIRLKPSDSMIEVRTTTQLTRAKCAVLQTTFRCAAAMCRGSARPVV